MSIPWYKSVASSSPSPSLSPPSSHYHCLLMLLLHLLVPLPLAAFSFCSIFFIFFLLIIASSFFFNSVVFSSPPSAPSSSVVYLPLRLLLHLLCLDMIADIPNSKLRALVARKNNVFCVKKWGACLGGELALERA